MKGRLVVLVSLLVLVCHSCADREERPSSERPRILLSMKGPGGGNPFWTAVEAGARKAASRLNVRLVVLAPPSEADVEAQIAQIEDQIVKEVDALVVAPTDVVGLNPTFAKAARKGIPVIFVDTDADWPGKVSFIGTDNRKAGYLGGHYLCGALPRGSAVGLITGVMSHQTHIDRTGGARAAMRECGLLIVAEQAGNSERALGQAVMEDFLVAHPEIAGVFTGADVMALGANEAIKAAGKLGQVEIVGFDGIPEAVESIAAGELAATVAQRPHEMGRLGIEAGVKTLQKIKVPVRVDTGAELITKANASEFLPKASR